jgi:hypothetical protein
VAPYTPGERMMVYTTLNPEEREKEMLKLLPAVMGITATIQQVTGL